MKKVLILSTSPRIGGNSNGLAEEFARGAKDAGNDVEKISLHDKTLQFCIGCLACQKSGRCVLRDDMDEIIEKMKKADCLVFATPIYFYSMSGQMKTLLDRSNPLFTTDYAFRDIYLLMSAAEDEESTITGSVKGLQGWIDCYDKTRLAGVVFAGEVVNVGEIKDHLALKNAYVMGRDIQASRKDRY